MRLWEPDTNQGLFAEVGRDCSPCPCWGEGRCRGPTTRGSLWDLGPNRVGCHNRTAQVALLEDLSRAWPRTPAPRLKIPALGNYIPQLRRGLPKLSHLPARRLYAVSLSDVLNVHGDVRFGSASALRRSLALPPQGRLFLLGTADDELLENFLEKADDLGSWERLRRLRFEVATSFSCSVYDNDPRFLQILNQSRNEYTYEVLVRLGIPTIPFLFCHAPEDFDAAVLWLETHPHVSTIADLAESYSSESDFRFFAQRLRYLCDRVSRPLHVVAVGCSAELNIRHLYSTFGSATITSANPIMQALGGCIATKGLRFLHVRREVPREGLFARNIEACDRVCERYAS